MERWSLFGRSSQDRWFLLKFRIKIGVAKNNNIQNIVKNKNKSTVTVRDAQVNLAPLEFYIVN